MKTNELLKNLCKELQKTVTPQWRKVELISKENTISYFESKDNGKDAFIGSDNYRYPDNTKVWGIEIIVDDRCVFRFYGLFEENESAADAEERITDKAILEICYECIQSRIEKSKSFTLYW